MTVDSVDAFYGNVCFCLLGKNFPNGGLRPGNGSQQKLPSCFAE